MPNTQLSRCVLKRLTVEGIEHFENLYLEHELPAHDHPTRPAESPGPFVAASRCRKSPVLNPPGHLRPNKLSGSREPGLSRQRDGHSPDRAESPVGKLGASPGRSRHGTTDAHAQTQTRSGCTATTGETAARQAARAASCISRSERSRDRQDTFTGSS